MKIIAINGSPRKNWNTYTLLENVLEGSKSVGAETEMINLYDLDYKGCISCMACKVKNRKNRCAVRDDLKPILEAIHEAEAVVLGSPIYFGDITGQLRAFWERFIFQYLNYDDYSKPLFAGSKKTAMIYTMNVSEDYLSKIGYDRTFENYGKLLSNYFQYPSATLLSTETLQVKDYNKYHLGSFNGDDRQQRHQNVFPQDCQKAFELGKTLASN